MKLLKQEDNSLKIPELAQCINCDFIDRTINFYQNHEWRGVPDTEYRRVEMKRTFCKKCESAAIKVFELEQS